MPPTRYEFVTKKFEIKVKQAIRETCEFSKKWYVSWKIRTADKAVNAEFAISIAAETAL